MTKCTPGALAKALSPSARTPRRPFAGDLKLARYVLVFAAASATPIHAQTRDATTLSLEQLLDIPVVGASKYDQKQKDIAAAVSVISRQEIEAFGWRTLSEALASLPGVYTTYDRQYSYLGTRGFGLPGDFNTRILLTVDGNRVNDAVYDQAYVGRDFPLDMQIVERIEFIPGPGGAVYGQNAMLGTVNVVTRRGSAVNGGEVAVSYARPQQAGEVRASWGRLFGNGTDVLVSAAGMHARGLDRLMTFGDAGVSGVAEGLDGERDTELFARLARGAWSAELVQGDRRKDDPTGVYLSDPLAPGSYQRDRMWLAQAQYQQGFRDDTVHLSVRVFLGRERYTTPQAFDGEATESGVASAWHGTEWRLLLTSWSRHKAMIGVEYQANTRQDQTFDNLIETPGAVDVEIPRSGWRSGVYVQDEVTLTRTVAATLGLRADRNNVTGHALSPRAGLRWQAAAATTVKALYGRAYRAPNVYEHDYDDALTLVANAGLLGETIDTLELVVDHRPGPDLVVRGTVYQWLMHGLIVQGMDAVADLPRFENGEDVKAVGVEVSADKTWGWGGRLRGSAAHQHVAFSSGGRPNNSPAWLEKLNLSSPLAARARAGYELQCSSARQAIDGSFVDGYCSSNLHVVTDAWANGLSLMVTVGNLLDTTYAHPGSRNNWQTSLEQDGRSVRASVRYKF